jgi:hypothetical protein
MACSGQLSAASVAAGGSDQLNAIALKATKAEKELEWKPMVDLRRASSWVSLKSWRLHLSCVRLMAAILSCSSGASNAAELCRRLML